jgi:hypothetical protein
MEESKGESMTGALEGFKKYENYSQSLFRSESSPIQQRLSAKVSGPSFHEIHMYPRTFLALDKGGQMGSLVVCSEPRK